MKIFFKLVEQNKIRERIALVRALREIDNYKHKIKFYVNILKDLERYGNYEIEALEIGIEKHKLLFLRNGIEITSENECELDNLIKALSSVDFDKIKKSKNIDKSYYNEIRNDIKSLKMRLIYLKTGKLVDGCIPPYTECPYKSKCVMVNNCYHLGRKHNVAFSCGFARTFEV